jgi:hypothetical protein
MRNLILVVRVSLDGFVAGVKGELDGFHASDENLRFVCSLTEDADAALFGRISHQTSVTCRATVFQWRNRVKVFQPFEIEFTSFF